MFLSRPTPCCDVDNEMVAVPNQSVTIREVYERSKVGQSLELPVLNGSYAVESAVDDDEMDDYAFDLIDIDRLDPVELQDLAIKFRNDQKKLDQIKAAIAERSDTLRQRSTSDPVGEDTHQQTSNEDAEGTSSGRVEGA